MKPPPRLAAVAQRQPPKMTPETINKLILWIQQGWKCSLLIIDTGDGNPYETAQPIEPAG